jgi:hypothetical protein
MSVPAVLVRKSTKQIIKEALYPNADMSPVQGLDPDYEWLVKHVPFAEPDYDSRLYIMQMVLPDMTALDSFIEHPSYAGIREYRITYNPNKRPDAEIILSIENAEKEANNGVFSEAVHKDEFAFMLNSVHKDAKGQALNAAEQDQIDKLAIVTVNLAKNKDAAAIKIAQVVAGNEPNIDLGWVKSL